jgi:hypothetical protein
MTSKGTIAPLSEPRSLSVKGEGFADAKPGAPQHDDQATQPRAVGVVAGGAHDGDDLFDRWRVSGVTQPLVAAVGGPGDSRSPWLATGAGRQYPRVWWIA